MTRRGRKRKMGAEDKAACDWEKDTILPENLRDELESMWEIPQIYHFLQLTKEVLNITHLSMYEVERMFLMPKQSKQLAHIMTCLLSSPSTMKSKQQKVPPMPYEFWTNIVMHKLKSWFKIYETKKEDRVKVFEAFGIEPEFWNIFPNDFDLNGKDFHDFSLKQRVWLLKTVCDTVMHLRKSVQEEISKQPWESQFETVLGMDRHGARYVYFPQFLFNDLRIYRHCLDNKILSTVKPPVRQIKSEEEAKPKLIVKEESKIIPRMRKRRKRRKSRWSNGALPTRKIFKRKLFDYNVMEQMDSNSNSIDAFSSRSSSKMSEVSADSEKCIEDEAGENTCDQQDEGAAQEEKETTQKDTEQGASNISTSLDTEEIPLSTRIDKVTAESPKSDNTNENVDEDPENCSQVSEQSMKVIPLNSTENVQYEKESILESEKCSNEVACEETQVKGNGEMVTNGETHNDESTENNFLDEDNSDGSFARRSERIKIKLEIEDAENLADVCESEQLSSVELRDSLCRTSSPENDAELFIGNLNDNFSTVENFGELIRNLGESNFQLVADSLDGLKDLIEFITYDKTVPGLEMKKENYIRPSCEEKLLERMNVLYVSLEKVESILKESMRKARNKLQQEWNFFEKGVASEDGTNTSSDQAWIDGNPQGWQLIAGSQDRVLLLKSSPSKTCSRTEESEFQSHEESANIAEVEPERKEQGEEILESKSVEDEILNKDNEKNERSQSDDKIKDPKENNENEIKCSTRVLRTRGVSSYTELFDEDSSEEDKLTGWTDDIEAVYADPCPQTGRSTPDSAAKNHGSDLEDEEAEDSDQDWILPSSRRRTRKRSSTGRRLKNFQHKVPQIKVDPVPKEQDPLSSTNSEITKRIPPLKIVLPKLQVPEVTDKKPEVTETDDSKLHTELDIKEEAPAYDATTNQPNYVVGQQQPATSYYVMQQNPPVIVPNNQFIQPTFISQVVQQPQVPQMQQIHSVGPNGQLYVYQAAPTNNLSGSPNIIGAPTPSQQAYMSSRVVYQPHAQLVSQPQAPAKFVQFVTTTAASAPQTQTHHANYAQMQQFIPQSPQQPRIINSTTLRPQHQIRYQRPTAPFTGNTATRPPFPHPNGAVIRSMPLVANVLRPGQRVAQQRAVAPRRQNIPRMPLVQNRSSSTNSLPNKSSSLIVLSDSDDEIEMIVQDKTKAVKQTSKPAMPQLLAPKPKPSIPVELLQRVSEGGISISPVKPAQPSPSPSTQLVVVVNETGSHYALALPNGSKLILTPDQVAQIRASNGGKLVL